MPAAAPSTAPVSLTSAASWSARPKVAWAIRVFVFLAPFVASVGVTAWVSQQIPPVSHTGILVLWWIFLSAVATAVVIAVDRVARRLMPLSVLFGLTLAFPDAAPSRYKTALRSGTTKQLRQRVDEVRRVGLGATPAEAAKTIVELLAALSAHDRITRGHAERVRAYSRLIGAELGLDRHDLDRLQWAGLIHDVGKLFVPSELLNKPGRLTADEYEQIKRHVEHGAELVAPLEPWLGEWVLGVEHHHEKFDGSGYPLGLAGRDISLAGRIVAVADVYDVLTSVRSYKRAIGPVEARKELLRCAGTHFDPAVVRAFLAVSVGRMRMATGPLAWLAQVPLVAQLSAGGAAASAGGSVVATSAGAAVVAVGAAVGLTVPESIEKPRPEVAVVEEVDLADAADLGSAAAGGAAVAPDPAPPVGGDRVAADPQQDDQGQDEDDPHDLTDEAEQQREAAEELADEAEERREEAAQQQEEAEERQEDAAQQRDEAGEQQEEAGERADGAPDPDEVGEPAEPATPADEKQGEAPEAPGDDESAAPAAGGQQQTTVPVDDEGNGNGSGGGQGNVNGQQ